MTTVHVPLRSRPLDAIARIRGLSGENVQLCMQCGTCSAVCPMAGGMSLTPRAVMHLLQFGRHEELVEAGVGEHCAACHSCTVRCPRGIDVARALEAVRLLSLRRNQDLARPDRVPESVRRQAPQIALVSAFRKLTA